MPTAFTLLCSLTRRALTLEEGNEAEPVTANCVAPLKLMEAIRRHRVADLFHAHAEPLGLPDEITDQLTSWHEEARPLLMLQALETVRSISLLSQAGVRALAIKGVALAVLTTGRADARGGGDVDILVSPDDLAVAHDALIAGGWSLYDGASVEPGTWAFRHINRWGSALTYQGAAASIDLHWRLEVTPSAYPQFSELWDRRATVSLGGGAVPTLSAADALRHSAAHREGWFYQRTLVDLRRLARVDGVFDAPLRPLALTSLALARETIGLPADIPGSLAAQLATAPGAQLERARAAQHRDALPTFQGGLGSAMSLRNRLAAGRTPTDLGHTLVALIIPAHAAMPVTARSRWVGIPTGPRATGQRSPARTRPDRGEVFPASALARPHKHREEPRLSQAEVLPLGRDVEDAGGRCRVAVHDLGQRAPIS